jgi:hypothetical protein
VDAFLQRVAEIVERMPACLRALLEAERAAGNEVNSLEKGRGPDAGKVALILNHPFRAIKSDALPTGVKYREFLDRDPRVWEFYSDDEMFSLVTAKFKPMKLAPLPPGPPNPTEKHVEFMKKRAAEEEEAARRRAEAAALEKLEMLAAAEEAEARRRAAFDEPSPPIEDDALKRFLASMIIDYEKWHDGVGYDLDALQELSDDELEQVETKLINHSPRDWRDIEALACIDSPRARKTVEAALQDPDPKVRQEAREHAPDKIHPADRERRLIQLLETAHLYGGLSEAIDEAEEFHPPAVIDTLLRGALRRDGGAAVHFAALLCFLHGKAAEPFDWNHRPFYLRFHDTGKAREAAFRELCDRCGIDARRYLA